MNEVRSIILSCPYLGEDEGYKQVFEACLTDLQLHTWTVIVMERVMFVLDVLHH
jgi:hypothetical protein